MSRKRSRGGRPAPVPRDRRGTAAATDAQRRRRLVLAGGVIAGIAALAAVTFALRPSGPGLEPQAIGRTDTADVHSLRFAGSPEHLLLGHHGGVLETRDGGRTWRPLAANADAMSMEVSGESIVIAGHDIFQGSDDGGRTWAPIEAALPSLDIHAFARSRLDPDTMWAYLAGGGIWRTDDGGRTFTEVYQGDAVALAAIAPDGRDVLLGIDPFAGLVRSEDAGRTWRPLGRPPGTPVASMAATPDGNTILLGTGQGLYRTDDAGASWRTPLPETTFLAVAVSDDGRTVVAVSDRTEVYRSDDGGATWSAAA